MSGVSNTCLFAPAQYNKLNKGFFLGFLFKPLVGLRPPRSLNKKVSEKYPVFITCNAYLACDSLTNKITFVQSATINLRFALQLVDLTLCILGIFSCINLFADFFSKSSFSNNSFRNIIRVSNSLDPDQARYFVGPDLGPNCLQSYQQTVLER